MMGPVMALSVHTTLFELIQRCRQQGLRKTLILEKVLTCLLETSQPTSIQEIVHSKALAQRCDPATIYRLLGRLEEKGIVRRIGVHERAAHYILNDPNEHHDYVICVDCGTVQTLHFQCPAEALEEKVSRETGFENLYHELQFYGKCPRCQRAPTSA